MDIEITPHLLRGSVTPPPSKSQSHRFLIAAALAGEQACVHHLADSRDIQATTRCLRTLLDPQADDPLLDCGESGSTLRFLLPLALVLRGGGRFTGQGRLLDRPQGPYAAIFAQQGADFRREGQILSLSGRLSPGVYQLPGDVSSQFVSGLLFALPLLWEDSEIRLTSPLESRSYVDMTLEALSAFHVQAQWSPDGQSLLVPGGQRYTPAQVTVEGDWSQAAFWYAANFLNCALDVQGLRPDSAQGDRVIRDFYTQLAQPGEAVLDLADCPDLLPPLAVMAALREGDTRMVKAQRLRLKESDRLRTTADLLKALGGQAEETEDGLLIHGVPQLRGGTVDGANDHRIVMAAAIAAAACTESVTILGAEAVEKSYPSFFTTYSRLGGVYHVL